MLDSHAHVGMAKSAEGCSLATTLGVLLVLFFAATLIVFATQTVHKRCVKRLSSEKEGFVDGYEAAHVRPANEVGLGVPTHGFGAELLPLQETTGADVRVQHIQDHDMAKFGALRPYVPHTDENRGNALKGEGAFFSSYTYHVEMPPRAFRNILERIVKSDAKKRKEEKEHTERSRTEWEYEDIHVDRLPREVRYVVKEYYADRVNETARRVRDAQQYTSENPFLVTVTVIDSAKTGIRVSEEEVSIFDLFKLTTRLCFHRSGKSVGLCARIDCSVDVSGNEPWIVTESAEYIGVLPETFAAADVAAPA